MHAPIAITLHTHANHPFSYPATHHTHAMLISIGIPKPPTYMHGNRACIATPHGCHSSTHTHANLHTRILHALMYITTLPCITILHLPIFLLLTTFLSLHHIPFMHCFLSLHHHHYQTLIFSLTHSLSTPYPVISLHHIPIFQIPINPPFLAHFQSLLNLFSCTMDWRSPRPVSAF